MKKSALVKAFVYVWNSRRSWVLASLAITLTLGLVPVATMWVSKELINSVARLVQGEGSNYGAAFLLLVLQFLLLLTSSFLDKAQTLLDKSMEFQLNHDLQRLVLEKISSAPLAFFDKPVFYQSADRINNEQGMRFLKPVKQVMDIGRQVTTIVSFLTYLISVHWSLVVISIIGSLPTLFLLVKLGNSRYVMSVNQTPLGREANYLKRLLTDRLVAKEVRLFQLKTFLLNSWSVKYRKNTEEVYRLTRKEQVFKIALDVVTGVLYLGAAGLIIWLIRTTKLTVGDFMALGQAVSGTQGGINQIAQLVAGLFEGSLYVREFYRFLEQDYTLEQASRGNTPFPMPLQKGLQVDRVSFRYPGSNRQILRDVSFSMAPGERVAIVGDNGSGKTTLVKCLMGLYPVDEGQIRFDGVPLEEIGERSFFQNVAVIFQDFQRYEFTVHENIGIGNLEAAADRERVEEVGRQTGVDSIVERFAKGYDTYLGRQYHDGEDLSGGQWQKIGLARALFADGQIVILDEPTAALDPHAEMEVFEQFDLLTRNKTAIFISHRMAAARMADRILVMKDGEVVENGTHDELMALGGEYSEMYSMQAKWYN